MPKGGRKIPRPPSKSFVIVTLLALTLLILPRFSMSQAIEEWSNLGLYGGQILDIAIDASNCDRLFAASYMGDGLFVTENGGSDWQAVETINRIEGEDLFRGHSVFAVKMAPSDSDVIWAAHEYWVEKSVDGGRTWTHIFNHTMQQECRDCGRQGDNWRACGTLAIDPFDSDIVYVGTGGPFATSSRGSIYRTDDGGRTWTKTGIVDAGLGLENEFDYIVVDIDIDPQDRDTIWAVTNSDYGGGGVEPGTLYRGAVDRMTGKITWGLISSLVSFGFTSVAVKPNDPNVVFTGSIYGIIKHYSLDGGKSWYSAFPIEQDSTYVQDLQFDPNDPGILYASWFSRNHYVWAVGRSHGGGEAGTWKIYTTGDKQLRTLAINPANTQNRSKEIIFGGHPYRGMYKGVYESQVDDYAWTPINNGINAVIVYDVAIDPEDSTHILAGCTSGLYEKRDAGDWVERLPHPTFSVRFHPTDSLTYYAGIWGQLAKTEDGGGSWRGSLPLGQREVWDIAVDPTDTDTIYLALAARGGYGNILKSQDGGMSFVDVLSGENQYGQKYDFNSVVVAPDDPKHILAGGGNFFAPPAPGDLWESNDAGANWTRVEDLQNVVVSDLLIDPHNPHIVYAGCGSAGATEIPLYRRTDGGKTWAPSHEGLPKLAKGLVSVWGASGTDVYAVGLGILHYDGTWAAVSIDPLANLYPALYCVWGSSGTDIFAVGFFGTILHYDGVSWSAIQSGSTKNLEGVWGSSGADFFVVGNDGTILHYDGSSWVEMESGTTKHLHTVWGSSPTEVFAVGHNGTILHYDGTSWSAMESGTTEDLYGVWGSSGIDVFATGPKGTILHYDGITWTQMDSGTTEGLARVWGSSSKDVFAVGALGTILHYDGNKWEPMGTGGITEWLNDVWGTSGTDVFVVGGFGSILHYDGGAWSVMKPAQSRWNSVTDLDFHRKNTNIVYAATFNSGVYVSPNQGGNWLNLGTPKYYVLTIAASSLYAATQGGLWQCTGTGIIAGRVTDAFSQAGLHRATVFNDMGAMAVSIGGEYMMSTPSGICCLTAIADGYSTKTLGDVTVYGGDVTWVNFAMGSGVSEPLYTEGGKTTGGGGCFISGAAHGFCIAGQIGKLSVLAALCLVIAYGTVAKNFKPRCKKNQILSSVPMES